jgi:uncharacterized protein (TIGR02145 family)
MPDNKWWLAQNVKLASYSSKTAGVVFSTCDKEQCGRGYTVAETIGAWGGTSGSGANIQGVCPSGWVLPTLDEWQAMFKAIDNNLTVTAHGNSSCGGNSFSNTTVTQSLAATAGTKCTTGNNKYGWASQIMAPASNSGGQIESYWTAQTKYQCNSVVLNHIHCINGACGTGDLAWIPSQYRNGYFSVRCFR